MGVLLHFMHHIHNTVRVDKQRGACCAGHCFACVHSTQLWRFRTSCSDVAWVLLTVSIVMLLWCLVGYCCSNLLMCGAAAVLVQLLRYAMAMAS